MIVVVGSVNMDLVVTLPEIPKVGETVNGGVFMTNPGGKGANQAVAAAKLGSDVQFIGCMGDDGFAAELRDNMRAAGIGLDGLETLPGCKSGIALIQVDQLGRNNIAVASGANFAITKDVIDRHGDLFRKADLAVFQLEISMDANLYALRMAREAGCTVLLNPSPVADLPEEVFQNVDILVPNEHELARFTGMDCSTLPGVEAAAKAMRKRGVGTIVTTLGEHGAMYMDKDKTEVLPAHRVRAVDTTAAGDAFLGGFAHSYEKNRDIAEAVGFGQRVAAYSVQHAGAQQSMPTMGDLA